MRVSKIDELLVSLRGWGTLAIWMFLLVILALAYSPPALSPFLWADDWYGLARFGPYYGLPDPKEAIIDNLSGGRFFPYIFWYYTNWLFPYDSIEDTVYPRIVTIIGFSVFALSLYAFFKRARVRPSVALLLAISTTVLPGLHPWMNFIGAWHMPMFLALLVVAAIPFFSSLHRRRWGWLILTAAGVILICIANFFNYQSLGSLFWGLAVFWCFNHPREALSKRVFIRYGIISLVGILSTALYFFIWRICVWWFNITTQARAVGLSSSSLGSRIISEEYLIRSYELFVDLSRFFSYGGPQFHVLIFGLFILHLVLAANRPKVFACLVLKLLFCAGALFATFIPYLFAFGTAAHVHYRLIHSSMISEYLLLWGLLLSALRVLGAVGRSHRMWTLSRAAAGTIAAAVCIYAVIFCQYGLTKFMTVPRVIEYRYLRAELEKRGGTTAKLIHIIPMPNPTDTLAPYSYRRDVGEAQLTRAACTWVLGSHMVHGALFDLQAPNTNSVRVFCGDSLPDSLKAEFTRKEIVRIDMRHALRMGQFPG